MTRLIVIFAALTGWLSAQIVPVKAECADEEIREFGLVCDEDEPCPLFLEIAAVEAVGARLFAAGNLHTGQATLWSLLLMSEDNGKTWREPHARQRGHALDVLQFVDFENGWVSGHLAGSLARDPYLLRTTDGGKTWRRLPLYRDSTVAFIEQFRFDTKDQGEMVVQRRGTTTGRYQRLETRDGGATWMLREAGEDPPEARGARANADWRVRADVKANTIGIEKREAGRWRAVALFPLIVTQCAPRAEEAREPEPEPPPEEPPA
jgi:hypothetical protein